MCLEGCLPSIRSVAPLALSACIYMGTIYGDKRDRRSFTATTATHNHKCTQLDYVPQRKDVVDPVCRFTGTRKSPAEAKKMGVG